MSKFNDEADDYDVTLVRETDAAWGVHMDPDDDVIWLPKSQCEFPSRCQTGKVVTVTVPNWLAEEKGLI